MALYWKYERALLIIAAHQPMAFPQFFIAWHKSQSHVVDNQLFQGLGGYGFIKPSPVYDDGHKLNGYYELTGHGWKAIVDSKLTEQEVWDILGNANDELARVKKALQSTNKQEVMMAEQELTSRTDNLLFAIDTLYQMWAAGNITTDNEA